HQHVDRTAAGRLAENCDFVCISTECGYIPLNPFHCGDLVHIAVVTEQAIFAFFSQSWMRQKTKPTDAVVEAHENQSPLCELAAVIYRRRTSAIDETAAVDPNQHG